MSEQLLLDLGPPLIPTFANFLPGQNAQAVSVLQQIKTDLQSKGLTLAQPPFVTLWGPAGTGKTHLLKALGGWALSPSGDHELFKGAIHAPLVTADDVQTYSDWQQQELFKLYNYARQQGGPIIVASVNQAVMQLILREDLRSRLLWGLTFGLSPLSDEEVIDALSQHVRARGLSLSPEVVLYVLHRFTRDMGTLMQVIDCIDRYAMQHKRTITVALVREMISARSRLS